jgi:septal ring factor EnvC (AmiA/AmiB activator)
MIVALTCLACLSLAANALLAWRITHPTPDPTMADNTKLAQLTADLATATTQIRGMAAENTTLRAANTTLSATNAALAAQLDALPDLATVQDAQATMQAVLDALNASTASTPQATS